MGHKMDVIKALLFLFLVPSLSLFYFSYNTGSPSAPYFNIDYLVMLTLLTLLCRVRRFPCAVFAILGVAVIAGVQITSAIGGLFVSEISALVDYFAFVEEWPWNIFVPFIVASVVFLMGYYVVLRKIDYRSVPIWVAPILLIIVICLDFLGTVSPLKLKNNLFEANIATSSAAEIYGLAPRILNPVAWEPSPVDAPLKQRLLGGVVPDRILSVAVEAWGVMQDEAFNHEIRSGFEQLIGNQYSIRSKNQASNTGTINGEFRDLCGLTIMSIPSAEQAKGVREHCLPAILAAKGWKTYGLHGNSGLFYDRRRIYPAIGFDNVRFREDFDKLETASCRSIGFTGWCDQVVLRHGLAQLSASKRSFVHVMTLDTHLPLKAAKGEMQRCSDVSEDICLYISRFSRALENIAKAINEAPVKPDIVFIWGDHPPPYIHKEVRDQFVPNRVPMMILTLKSTNTSSGARPTTQNVLPVDEHTL